MRTKDQKENGDTCSGPSDHCPKGDQEKIQLLSMWMFQALEKKVPPETGGNMETTSTVPPLWRRPLEIGMSWEASTPEASYIHPSPHTRLR